MKPFEHILATEKSFGEAVAAVEKKAAEKGFQVPHTHDVAATLGRERLSARAAEDHRNL